MINSDMARSSDEHPPASPAWSFRRPPRRSVQVLTPPVGPHTDPVLHALRFPVDACVPLSLRPARPLPLVRGEPVGWRLHDSKRRACVRTNGLIARTMLHTPSLFRGGRRFRMPAPWVGWFAFGARPPEGWDAVGSAACKENSGSAFGWDSTNRGTRIALRVWCDDRF